MTPDPRPDLLGSLMVPMWDRFDDANRAVLRPHLRGIVDRLDTARPATVAPDTDSDPAYERTSSKYRADLAAVLDKAQCDRDRIAAALGVKPDARQVWPRTVDDLVTFAEQIIQGKARLERFRARVRDLLCNDFPPFASDDEIVAELRTRLAGADGCYPNAVQACTNPGHGDGEVPQSEVDDLRWESLIDGKIGKLAKAAGIDRDGLDWEDILGCVRVILDALRDKAGAKANDLVAPAVSVRVGVAGTPSPIVARLARAAGVSPDSEDPVGAIEAAIRAGREPEVVTGAELPAPTSLADDEGIVADSFGLAAWVHDSGDKVYVDRDREVLVRPGRGQYVLSSGWLGQAVMAAERWADAYLEVGDVVTGDRAVSAPVGTKLGAKAAAVAAVHTTGGWSVTGMNGEQDHEHAVRINEWVVLALPEATS